jgi:starch synthase
MAANRHGSSALSQSAPCPSPTIALLPWGDVIEDFLDEIGVSVEDFAGRMTGGWLFGYVDALRLRGIRTTIVCFSRTVQDTVRRAHEPTGAQIVLLRAPSAYRALRRRMKDPYGWTVDDAFAPANGFSRQCWRLAHHVAPYLATPVTALTHEIRRAGCCGIICQDYESPRFDACLIAGGLLRIPVFGTFQGGNWHRSAIERVVRPITLRRSAGLIIGSSVEAARVKQRYGMSSEKISSTFNPLDLSEWRPDPRRGARRTLGIPDTTRVAIWHGRIDIPRKGLDVLLEAWKLVCSLQPESDVLLLLVGSGRDASLLDEAIRRLAVPHVRWVRGYMLDKPAIRQYLSAADVSVFPSRHEGFPVAPLEAMACGLPVVAAAAPGVADIFDEGEASGGLVVPVGDAISLARSLARLLNDEAAARVIGERARLRVERAFSLESVGAQLYEFIRERGGLQASLSPTPRS